MDEAKKPHKSLAHLSPCCISQLQQNIFEQWFKMILFRSMVFKIALIIHLFAFFLTIKNVIIIILKSNVVYESFIFFKIFVLLNYFVEITLIAGVVHLHTANWLWGYMTFNCFPLGHIFRVCTSRHNNWQTALVKTKLCNLVTDWYIMLYVVFKIV